MDNETDQLEEELARLRPATPSRTLIKRIDSELAVVVAPRAFPWTEWILAAALPAAAVITLLLTQLPRSGDAPAVSDPTSSTAAGGAALDFKEASLKPVAAEKVLVSATDEGLVTLQDGTPARRERVHYVDTITWKNPRTNASLTWSVPREEVRVVPIAFQ
jgi:hypothetical protein